MSARRCDCMQTVGITPKGISTRFKIFRCPEHGFICPLCGWQFKDIGDLEKHLKDYGGYQNCDGKWRNGEEAIESVLFEIDYYKLKQKLEEGGED